MKERVVCSRFLEECLLSSETATDCINDFLVDYYNHEQVDVLSLEDINISKIMRDRISKIKVVFNANNNCFLIDASKNGEDVNYTLKCKIKYVNIADMQNKKALVTDRLSKKHVVSLIVTDKFDEAYDIKYYFDIQKVGDIFWLVSEKCLRNYKGIERNIKYVMPINIEDVIEVTKEFTA